MDMKNKEVEACTVLLFEVAEILSSVGMASGSSAKEEIPAFRKLIFQIEGLSPDLRAELDVHAQELERLLKDRARYSEESFWQQIAGSCHRMLPILRRIMLPS